MKSHWRTEIPHLLAIGLLFVTAAVVWPLLPDRLPVHWNLAGEVDRFGGKFEGLLLVPLIALGMYGLLLFLPLIDPKRRNFEQFQTSYLVMRWSLTLFMAAMYGLMLANAFGQKLDMTFWIMCLVSALFIVLGMTMGNVQPNWFVGVRTPWTLSSRLSWEKTHQLAKWVFVAMGLSFLTLGFIKNVWALAAVLSITFGGIGYLVVYSYLIWKRDPDRIAADETANRSAAASGT